MRTIAKVGFNALSHQAPVVVLAPHPDDETLGCGGLLAQAFGHYGAHVICLTDGSASHPNSKEWPPHRLARKRRQELESAVCRLGGQRASVTWLGLRDSRLETYDISQIAEHIATIVQRCGARTVLAPSPDDHHADHKATARIARTLAQRNPQLSSYSYPVWSRWDDPDFLRNVQRHDPVYFETAPFRSLKRAAINAHESQLGQCVGDDPDGFRLDPLFIEKFITEDEIFWRAPPCP